MGSDQTSGLKQGLVIKTTNFKKKEKRISWLVLIVLVVCCLKLTWLKGFELVNEGIDAYVCLRLGTNFVLSVYL